MHPRDTQSRREFFKLAGVAGSALAVGSVFGRPGFAAEEGSQAEKKKAPFSLGLASYTLRKFDLDQTLAMTKRVGLTHICLKSFHLPLDATAEQIAAAAAKVKEAGLDLYGGGVITMKTDKDVNQAFDYAKAAGMRTIVGAPIPDVLPLVEREGQAVRHRSGHPQPRAGRQGLSHAGEHLPEGRETRQTHRPVHRHRPHAADRR